MLLTVTAFFQLVESPPPYPFASRDRKTLKSISTELVYDLFGRRETDKTKRRVPIVVRYNQEKLW